MPLPDLIQATCMHIISNEAFVRFRPLPLRFYAIQGYLDSNPISCQCSIYILLYRTSVLPSTMNEKIANQAYNAIKDAYRHIAIYGGMQITSSVMLKFFG